MSLHMQIQIEDAATGSHTDDHFVYQAGHKLSLLHALWICSGDDLFDTDVDEHYDAAERFKNNKNKSQA